MTTDNDDYQECMERAHEEYEQYCQEQKEYYEDFLIRIKNNQVDNCCEYSYWMDLININNWNNPICMSCRKKLLTEFARNHRRKYERTYLKKRIVTKKTLPIT